LYFTFYIKYFVHNRSAGLAALILVFFVCHVTQGRCSIIRAPNKRDMSRAAPCIVAWLHETRSRQGESVIAPYEQFAIIPRAINRFARLTIRIAVIWSRYLIWL